MKAVIVECLLPKAASRVDEVNSMAKTIGYHIVDVMVQRRKSDHHSYTIGPGKLEELKSLVEEKVTPLVIFTNTVPSSRIFKIQKKIGHDVKVIDRNLLILELFEKRARTREALLQIQLARLKYTFSWGREYLKLQGILGEQVGWSGPGEYPFQNYEREARKRISKMRRELEDIRRKKDALRTRRHELGFPIVALAGYTQSGKTTFFNGLSHETKHVGLGPFTTLSTFARRVQMTEEGGSSFILIDSIGFIEDMHPTIIDAFDSTLKEIADADLMLLFVDASDDLTALSRRLVSSNNILRRIDARGEVIVCINKIDLTSQEKLQEVTALANRHLPGSATVSLSAKTGENIRGVLGMIRDTISSKGMKSVLKTQEGPSPASR